MNMLSLVLHAGFFVGVRVDLLAGTATHLAPAS
jgi:hypothetical protein